MALDARKKKILEAVIEQFIDTGAPVGSKYVAQAMDNAFSSATIRNDMAALETAGLLEQPHTSSGRIPTHMGYRAYIDDVMQTIPLTSSERAEIDALFNVRNADPDQLLQDAADALSRLTGLASITTTMIHSTVTVKKIEIIPAGEQTVVILMIASTGVIKSKVCRVDFNVTPQIVDFFMQFAQQRLVGRSIDEITGSYLKSVSVSLGDYSRLFMPVFSALYELAREIDEGQYFARGMTNLLEHSELAHGAYDLFSFIEQRRQMREMIASCDRPVQIMIGRESSAGALEESSVVIARYPIGKKAMGAIGLIGPTRMDYARLLPQVEYFAATLGKLLSETYNE